MILRLIAYLGLYLFIMLSIVFAVGLGVLIALMTFWKTDMLNGLELSTVIATGISMEKDYTESKKKEKKNEDKTGRKHTDR